MTLDESYEIARRVKPVRCPRCRKSSLVLMFDSPARGMVCPHCHEKLIALRNHVSVLAGDRGVATAGIRKKKSTTCPRCRETAHVLQFDSPLAGMVCNECHDDLMYSRQEVVGLIPNAP